ncbi:MAG TPA: hypothetical protein VF677_16370 [Flavobacterium sp.]|jgi:hypothetical protein
MYKLSILSLIASIVLFSGCEKDNNVATTQEFNFGFQSDSEGWVGDFADYPSAPDQESMYELQFSHAMLPNPLNTSDGALRQSGTNHSDDLFMFVKKKITGLEPNRNYTVSIEIEIATNAPSGRMGVGGPPGEGVAIKAGASTIEPLKVSNNTDNHYRMNVDKGNQSTDGPTIKFIGDFANGTNSEDYRLKRLSTSSPVNVQSNANGELWLIVGTDSGFEATTTIYYNYIKAVLR